MVAELVEVHGTPKNMTTRFYHVIPLGTHPQPLPLVNGGEKKITKRACHSHESGNPRHTPAQQKNEMPAYTPAHKFASMTMKKCLSPKKGHNDTTIHVIPALSRNPRHNSTFFHPSLKRVARFIGTRDDQKYGNPAYNSVPHLQRGIIVLLDVVTNISPRRGGWLPLSTILSM